MPKVLADPIDLCCSSRSFTYEKSIRSESYLGKRVILNCELSQFPTALSTNEKIPTIGQSYMTGKDFFKTEFLMKNFSNKFSYIKPPDFNSLIADSCKLRQLDILLVKLYRENHRILIFCQMTKMLDILEDYMNRKKYSYFRLDGSCNIADRRDMVDEFQCNEKIFAFLLSTRAGGLGVTLTAADTVIFYDNDWNPTMDAQACDRAHRIGLYFYILRFILYSFYIDVVLN